jgi:hypothetical protein
LAIAWPGSVRKAGNMVTQGPCLRGFPLTGPARHADSALVTETSHRRTSLPQATQTPKHTRMSLLQSHPCHARPSPQGWQPGGSIPGLPAAGTMVLEPQQNGKVNTRFAVWSLLASLGFPGQASSDTTRHKGSRTPAPLFTSRKVVGTLKLLGFEGCKTQLPAEALVHVDKASLEPCWLESLQARRLATKLTTQTAPNQVFHKPAHTVQARHQLSRYPCI